LVSPGEKKQTGSMCGLIQTLFRALSTEIARNKTPFPYYFSQDLAAIAFKVCTTLSSEFAAIAFFIIRLTLKKP